MVLQCLLWLAAVVLSLLSMECSFTLNQKTPRSIVYLVVRKLVRKPVEEKVVVNPTVPPTPPPEFYSVSDMDKCNALCGSVRMP